MGGESNITTGHAEKSEVEMTSAECQRLLDEDTPSSEPEYELPCDAYRNAVIELSCSRRCTVAVVLLVTAVVVQTTFTQAINAESQGRVMWRRRSVVSAWMNGMRAKKDEIKAVGIPSRTDSVSSYLNAHQAALKSTPRILPEASAEICGEYKKVDAKWQGSSSFHQGDNVTRYFAPLIFLYGSRDIEGSLGRGRVDLNSVNPAEFSFLEEAMYQLIMMRPNRISFWTFVSAITLWGATILSELVDAVKFLYVLLSIEGIKCRLQKRTEDGKFELKGLSVYQKLMVFICGSFRIVLAAYLYYVGLKFLGRNVSVFDIVMNSVALGFVLEADTILFKAYAILRRGLSTESIVARPPSDSKVKAFESAVAQHRCIVSLCGLVMVAFSSTFAVHLQKQEVLTNFHRYASVCLFLGPTPNNKPVPEFAFPVQGLCDSIACDGFCGDVLSTPAGMGSADFGYNFVRCRDKDGDGEVHGSEFRQGDCTDAAEYKLPLSPEARHLADVCVQMKNSGPPFFSCPTSHLPNKLFPRGRRGSRLFPYFIQDDPVQFLTTPIDNLCKLYTEPDLPEGGFATLT